MSIESFRRSQEQSSVPHWLRVAVPAALIALFAGCESPSPTPAHAVAPEESQASSVDQEITMPPLTVDQVREKYPQFREVMDLREKAIRLLGEIHGINPNAFDTASFESRLSNDPTRLRERINELQERLYQLQQEQRASSSTK